MFRCDVKGCINEADINGKCFKHALVEANKERALSGLKPWTSVVQFEADNARYMAREDGQHTDN